jgi:hypothetical protein
MAVLAELVAAKRIQLRDHTQDGIADPLCLRAEFVHIDLVDIAVAGDLVRSLLRNDAQAALHDRKRLFDLQVFGGAVLV